MADDVLVTDNAGVTMVTLNHRRGKRPLRNVPAITSVWSEVKAVGPSVITLGSDLTSCNRARLAFIRYCLLIAAAINSYWFVFYLTDHRKVHGGQSCFCYPRRPLLRLATMPLLSPLLPYTS